ncbi:MAG: DUF1707 SHOCT-like domain-containing protein [Nocardioidaceae bacterium]
MEGRPGDADRMPQRQEQRHDPGLLRVSDADRHQVAEVLRHAAGEGRIDFDELDQRLEQTYAAKTYADLVPITADLPGHQPVQRPAPVQQPQPAIPASTYSSSVAVMSENRRRGVWLVPAQHTAFAMMGSVELDLREAQFETRDVTVTAVSIMGDVKVIVNPWTRVVVEGVPIMAEFTEAGAKVAAELTQESQVVRVKGFALMASVSVQRKAMPGESRRRLGRST